jgi:hypothetical protein
MRSQLTLAAGWQGFSSHPKASRTSISLPTAAQGGCFQSNIFAVMRFQDATSALEMALRGHALAVPDCPAPLCACSTPDSQVDSDCKFQEDLFPGRVILDWAGKDYVSRWAHPIRKQPRNHWHQKHQKRSRALTLPMQLLHTQSASSHRRFLALTCHRTDMPQAAEPRRR